MLSFEQKIRIMNEEQGNVIRFDRSYSRITYDSFSAVSIQFLTSTINQKISAERNKVLIGLVMSVIILTIVITTVGFTTRKTQVDSQYIGNFYEVIHLTSKYFFSIWTIVCCIVLLQLPTRLLMSTMTNTSFLRSMYEYVL